MHPGFLHWRRARGCAHEGRHAHDGGYETAGHHGPGGAGGGPMFGVRRPLRVMAHELELDDEQVEALARIIDELKTHRAQAAVDERKSIGGIADSLLGADFERGKIVEALNLRVQSAERL